MIVLINKASDYNYSEYKTLSVANFYKLLEQYTKTIVSFDKDMFNNDNEISADVRVTIYDDYVE